MTLDAARALTDSVSDHLSDHNTLHAGYNEDAGVQYVSLDGSASNHGRSWAAPKSTIADAVGEMTLNAYYKGRVVLGMGRFTAAEEEVPGGVDVVGQGMFSTQVLPSGDFGFRVSGTGQFNKFQDFYMSDDQAAFTGKAFWIRNNRSVTLRDIRLHYLSDSWAGTSDIDDAPSAIYVEGSTVSGADGYSDWHFFDNVHISGCYRGIVSAGNSHFKLANSTLMYQEQECIYIMRRDVGGGADAGGNAEMVNVTMQSQDSEYSMVCDYDAGVNNFGMVMITNAIFERVGATSVNKHHLYTDLQSLVLSGARFVGGSSSSGSPHAIYFGDNSANAVTRAWIAVAGGFGTPAMAGNTEDQTELSP